MRVLVAMSGGVDSSVAAALLKEQGHDVVGVTMRVWDGEEAIADDVRHGCYGPDGADIEDARRVAAALDMPFHVLDLREEYRAVVLDYFRSEYRRGRTPNPCVRCNPQVKLGAMLAKASHAGIAFDRFATGHYARIEYDTSRGRYLLRKARDRAKDQSYFLCYLSQEQLANAIFPLGDYTKAQVRGIAGRMGLPVKDKPESQDFVARDYTSLLGVGLVPGPIMDSAGNVLGRHKGIALYTVGQRKGLGLAAGEPMYVTAIDPERNAIIVGHTQDVYQVGLVASDLNWIAFDTLDGPLEAKARIRYRHEEAPATVSPMSDGKAAVAFSEPQMAITPGQAVVFYDGDVVLGGGTIETVGLPKNGAMSAIASTQRGDR